MTITRKTADLYPSGAPALAGFRNKIINGDFEIAQRATSQSDSGYGSIDRWVFNRSGGTGTMSRAGFAFDHDEVPGKPKYFCRVNMTAGSDYAGIYQKIEDVTQFSEKKYTITAYIRHTKSGAPLIFRYIMWIDGVDSLSSSFGEYTIPADQSVWHKVQFVVDFPRIDSGIASSLVDDNSLWCVFGQAEDDTSTDPWVMDVSHVSVVEGDALDEEDPFTPRHIGQELNLCQRYYQYGASSGLTSCLHRGDVTTGNTYYAVTTFAVPMRVGPTVTLSSAGVIRFNVGTLSVLTSTFNGFRVECDCNSTGVGQFNTAWAADAEL